MKPPARYKISIDPELIDIDAQKVVRRLKHFDHTAYLVGGCVRDLLLSRTPKDFDIATSATPRQVKKAFRNCRIIGRRFRLAHIYFRFGKLIECSTFRAIVESEDGDLLIRDDNVFGTEEEDARRRDFTINGLFFDPQTREVIDYVGGMEDVRAKIIRTIGDPEIRFKEDPCRMIRAIKFASRLGFAVEAKTWQALMDVHKDIGRSAPPRVLEEMLRTLSSGHAAKAFRLMHSSGLGKGIFPGLARFLSNSPATDEAQTGGFDLFLKVLDAIDTRDGGRRDLSNAVFLSSLVLPRLHYPVPLGPPELPQHRAYIDLVTRAIDEILGDSYLLPAIPKKDTHRFKQALFAQRRFLRAAWGRRSSPKKFVTKQYFPDSFELFRIGTTATGQDTKDVRYWESLVRQIEEEHPDGDLRPRPERKRRRRRPRRPRSTSPRGGARGDDDGEGSRKGDERPPKRSRRRKKPSGDE